MSRRRTDRARRRVVPAVVVAALAALALATLAAIVVAVALRAGDSDEERPARPSPTPTAAPVATASPTGAAQPTDAAHAPTADRPLAEALVAAAGRFVSADLGPRETPGSAALGEYGGSFSDGRDIVVLRVGEWSSPGAAAGRLDAPPADLGAADLYEAVLVGDPVVGEYRYYERGGRAVLRWTNGALLLELTGRPEAVRALYLAYPV